MEPIAPPLGPRDDLDPRLPLQPAPSAAPAPGTRQLFAAEHPYLYLFVLGLFVVTAAVALVVLGGIVAHVVVRGLLWAWGLA